MDSKALPENLCLITYSLTVKIPIKKTNQENNEKYEQLFGAFNVLTLAIARQTGNYKEAIFMMEEVLKKARDKLGEEHHEFVSAVNNLALLYEMQGKYKEAENLYLKCLKINFFAL